MHFQNMVAKKNLNKKNLSRSVPPWNHYGIVMHINLLQNMYIKTWLPPPFFFFPNTHTAYYASAVAFNR